MLKSRIIDQNFLKKTTSSIFTLKNGSLILLVLTGFSLSLLGINRVKSLQNARIAQEQKQNTAVLTALVFQSPQQRAATLQEMARGKQPSRARNRARYLLSIDLLARQQGAAALEYLRGLEKDYPLLAPQILFKTAQAYEQAGKTTESKATLRYLISTYPESPVVVDAWLQSNSSQDKKQLINQFPAHPRIREIARKELKKNPEQFELLLLLAKYSRESDLNPIRDRLVLEYPAQLTPEDWEAIADGYWREGEHRKAADAYTLASSTPRNLYRAARGFHRNGNIDRAERAYHRLLREYHDAAEAGLALLYLANISGGDEAVVYLERAIADFPAVAPQALLSKAVIHDAFAKSEAANSARQTLLEKYGDSSTAAAYRWQVAKRLAARGNKQQAWEWMQPVVKSNLNLEFAPKALYLTAKWAKDLGKVDAAHQTWSRAIALYPQSYWAWRSAVALGWNVGDFKTLRKLNPSVEIKETYAPLPMGSEALQELYFLGQYQDAWTLLQSEIERSQQATANEQFTEGLMLLKLGRTSEGMQEILELSKREDAQAIAQWQTLRKTTAYWHGLFPFPYQQDILKYAQKEKINPLLVISVMRKESTFNPEIDSHVGAIGLMQIVPPTAKWVGDQMQLKDYSLTKPEDNIKIGTWYLAHNHHRYDNNSLLAIASYNAGTGNVNQWLNKYNIDDPDNFVEQIPFKETHDYVEGVFGNYWNYLRLYNPQIRDKVNTYIENAAVEGN
ncbi:MAG: transglycosylase SLT domain-containing protein [Pleurocapsa sp.]